MKYEEEGRWMSDDLGEPKEPNMKRKQPEDEDERSREEKDNKYNKEEEEAEIEEEIRKEGREISSLTDM